MKDATAGRTSSENLTAGRTGNFWLELESALEAPLPGAGIVDEGVIDFRDVFEVAEVEIDVATVAGKRDGGVCCQN